MKAKLLILCLILASINCFSQNKSVLVKTVKRDADPNGFLGIGVFKIGSDTSVLMTFAKQNIDTIRDCSDFENLLYAREKNGEGDITQLLRLKRSQEQGNIGLIESYCPQVTEYYISRYIVSGILIKNIRLKYFQNKLVQFSSDFSNEIKDALTVKYGKSSLSVESKKLSCMHNLTGIATPLVEKTYTEKWTNGPIRVLSVLYDKYDDKCKLAINSFFLYTIDNSTWESCERDGRNAYLRKATAPKVDKKQLSDF
jgi:hypothetical protein